MSQNSPDVLSPSTAEFSKECYYCGGAEAAGHVSAFLFPTTEDAKKLAANEYQRSESGASNCKYIYVLQASIMGLSILASWGASSGAHHRITGPSILKQRFT